MAEVEFNAQERLNVEDDSQEELQRPDEPVADSPAEPEVQESEENEETREEQQEEQKEEERLEEKDNLQEEEQQPQVEEKENLSQQLSQTALTPVEPPTKRTSDELLPNSDEAPLKKSKPVDEAGDAHQQVVV